MRLRTLSPALLAIALAACSGDSTSAPAGVTGTWKLKSVTGIAAPVPWNANDTLVTASMEFPNDSQFVDRQIWHSTGDVLDPIVRGTYTSSGSTLTLLYPHDRLEHATFTGSTLTINPGGTGEWVFKR